MKQKITKHYTRSGIVYATGFGWAYTRRAYELMGGLFDICIVGASDYLMVNFLKGVKAHKIYEEFNLSPGYRNQFQLWR